MAVGEISNLKKVLTEKSKEFYRNFVAPKKSFKLLKHCDYLIYDDESFDTFKHCLPTLENVEVLCTRGEEINVWVAILSLKNYKYLKNPVYSYQITYVRKVNPKYMLTHIDNNPLFYKIANKFPAIKSVMIQNGIRDDFLKNEDNYMDCKVDYTLVHNTSIAEYFASHIKTKALVVGSIRNNAVPIKQLSSKNRVVYVSTYVDIESSENSIIRLPGGAVLSRDFIRIEVEVFQLLEKWCRSKSIDLVIAGAMLNDESANREKKFFSNLTDLKNRQYIKRTSINSTYELIDGAEMVVTIDSTIGYEALARGKKTALLAVRAKNLNQIDRLIGFPRIIEERFPFWTQDSTMIECERVLDYTWSADVQDWIKMSETIIPKLMEYDPKNLILKNLLNLSE
jgi:surface carbohydrate biosynthesis protein